MVNRPKIPQHPGRTLVPDSPSLQGVATQPVTPSHGSSPAPAVSQGLGQDPLSMGILQARILEWAAMPSSRESSQPRDRTQVSHNAEDSFLSEPPEKPKILE